MAQPNGKLKPYSDKRNFTVTPEPAARAAPRAAALSFVVQKHWSSRLHYDFRLELDGVLLSWAVPKGPSYDPDDKRMAVHVEDHPVSYREFEGAIPPKQYGAGDVIVWDRGTWEPVGDAQAGLAAGKLLFRLHGEKLAGLWELVRIAKPGDRQDPWILFKKRDAWARPRAEYDVISALPDSVVDRPLGLLEARDPRGAGSALAPADLPGARAAALPDWVEPQLAALATRPPRGPQWRFEVKLDGYRILARVDGGRVRLLTRNRNDWTAKMKPLAAAVEALGLDTAWLDGEVVVQGDDGRPDFSALQSAFDAAGSERMEYFVFDLPYLEGYDLRDAAWNARRALLRQVIGNDRERLRISADFAADGADMLATARALKLEGIVAKQVDAPYSGTRSAAWLKLKCLLRQEFVIGGYADREGSKAEVGALMLGTYDANGALQYAGNVGTGWTAATAADLRRRLSKLAADKSPFEAPALKPGRWSRRSPGTERWVRPELVAEVSFSDWTPDGHIRRASFQGLREDKPPRAVRREDAVDPPPKRQARAAPAVNVKVTHPERVVDASTGLTKLDLVRYYESVAAWMLPHLAGRPVSLVRGPNGIGGQLFFQKHDDQLSIPGLRTLDPQLWPGHAALLEVPSAQALVNAAQMNVIEFHTWNATARNLDRPNRIVFDLDPGEGVKWPQVQEAALLTRTLLDELGLRHWLKTSGGKGLHIVVPLAPRLPTDTVKAFSQAVVQHLAQTLPKRFVAKSGPANRVGKVYVDYLRNSLGATTAAAYSARARPGLGVSMPIAWEQLSTLKSSAQWSVATAREHLSFRSDDPWEGYHQCRQTLTAAMRTLGFRAR